MLLGCHTDFNFFANPRCGSGFVFALLERNKIKVTKTDVDRLVPEMAKRYSFAFVRHPAEWLRSFWFAVQVRKKWTPSQTKEYRLFTLARHSSLPSFVEKYADGKIRVGEILLGRDLFPQEIQWGTTEHLNRDLDRFLTAVQVPFETKSFRQVARQGAMTELARDHWRIPSGLRSKVEALEPDLMKVWSEAYERGRRGA